MTGHVDRCGYHEVLLSENGRTKNYLAHRLIAQTFIPNPDNHRFINHKDGDKTNNRVDNLEWCSRSSNAKHSYATGLQTKATNQYGTYRVLSEGDFDKIKSMHIAGYYDKDIASEIGCSRELVSRKIREWGIRK